MTDDAQAFANLMEGKVDPQRIADGVRLIESAQTQYSAAGRITGGDLNIVVQLELTSGESRAFKGTAIGFFADGSAEIGGYVFTTESENLFDLTRTFSMLSDGSRLYFYTKELTLVGYFRGTAAGHGLGHSPAFGDGKWS